MMLTNSPCPHCGYNAECECVQFAYEDEDEEGSPIYRTYCRMCEKEIVD